MIMLVMFLLLFGKRSKAHLHAGKCVTNGANPPELDGNIDSGAVLVRLAVQHRIMLFIDNGCECDADTFLLLIRADLEIWRRVVRGCRIDRQCVVIVCLAQRLGASGDRTSGNRCRKR